MCVCVCVCVFVCVCVCVVCVCVIILSYVGYGYNDKWTCIKYNRIMNSRILNAIICYYFSLQLCLRMAGTFICVMGAYFFAKWPVAIVIQSYIDGENMSHLYTARN